MTDCRKLVWLVAVLVVFAAWVLVGGCGVQPAVAQDNRYSVLILDSYHPGFFWSDEEIRGVRETVPDDVDLSVEYMDSKRLESPDYQTVLYATYRLKYAPDAFDCIIALDDYAFDFLITRGAILFPDTPVVFAGLSGFDPEMLRGREDVTGVVATPDIEGTIKVGLALRPSARKVWVVNDQTTSGKRNRAELESLIANGRVDADIVFLDQGDGLDLAQLSAQLSQAPADSIVYYAGFDRDRNGDTLDYREVLPALSKVSPVPMFVHADVFLDYGAVGGRVISGFSQGSLAAGLVERVLNGEPASNLVVQTPDVAQYVFDDSQLRRWGIGRSALPAGSVVVNGPESLYAEYKVVLWIGIGLVSVGLVLVVLVLLNQARRRRAENALDRERNLLRVVIDNVPDSIFVKDTNSRFLVANRGVARVMGAEDPERLLGKTDADFYPPEVARRFLADEMQVMASGEGIVGVEEPVPNPAGEVRWYSTTKVPLRHPDGTLGGTIGLGRDMTERRQAEAELKRRNRELVLLNSIIARSAVADGTEALLQVACREMGHAFDASSAVAFVPELGEKVSLRRMAWFKQDGCHLPLWDPIIEIQNLGLWENVQAATAVFRIDDQTMEAGIQPLQQVMRRRGVCEWVAVPLKVERRVVGWLLLEWGRKSNLGDADFQLMGRVAEHLSLAMARAQSVAEYQRLSAAVEQSLDNIIITDACEGIIYVNPAFETLTGYGRQEVLGRKPGLLKSDANDEAFHANVWQTLRAGNVWKGRLVNVKKDGSRYTVDATITPVRQEHGEITNYVAVERDITEELKLQEQAQRSQRMEAVGQLTAGIAHDFNNLLTAINGFAELTQAELDPTHRTFTYVGRILAAGQRAAQLVNQLLAFSRKQMISPRVVNLNDLVRNMADMLHRTIGEHIFLESTLAPDLWPVKMDPAQVEQILLNLAVNARDAMPGGGRLTIETTNVELTGPDIGQGFNVRPGEYVLVSVADTGCGMTPEVQARVFEPFFTTKEVGKGTGLGLATVFGIVKQNRGYVTVHSAPGQGCLFRLYFPAWNKPDEVRPIDKQDLIVVPTGSETILVVEDNPQVRELTAQVLEKQGYRVLVADGGAEARNLAEQHPEPIDLLVTDVVMPGQSGREVAERLLGSRPAVKVLFISGYEARDVTKRGLMMADAPFLEKPFPGATLARKVREVLDN